MSSFLKTSPHKIVVPLFFSVYLLTGLLIYDDYGTPWDEAAQITIGEVSYHYLCDKFNLQCKRQYIAQDTLPDFYDREYGPFFETTMIAVEEALSLRDARDVLLMRHLFVFLTFWAGAVFFYKIVKLRFDSWKFALLGAACLVLTPRMFAEAFYNSKDIVCLSFYIIGTFTLLKFLQKKSLLWCMVHSIVCALLVNLRMTGLVLPAITIFFIVLEVIRPLVSKTGNKKFTVISGILFPFLTAAFVIAFWPYLWEHPLTNFGLIFGDLMHRGKEGVVLYLGTFYNTGTPWHYLPVWILITTPILFTVYFLIGCVLTPPEFFRLSFLKNEKARMDLLFFLLFFMPVVAIIVLQTALYDGWRHMYFVYPAFLLVSLKGVYSVINLKPINTNYKAYLTAVIIIPFAITFSSLFFFLVKNHPFQYVYFNAFAGKHIAKKFEMDYWGVSYRQALEYVLKKDSSTKINIAVWDTPGNRNAAMIKPKDRARLNYTSFNEATYFICGGRFNFPEQRPYYPKFLNGELPFSNEIYSIQVGGEKIMRVYQLKN